MLRDVIASIVRQRFWVIGAITLVTALLGLQISNLKIVIDPNTMLPKSHPNVVGTNMAEALFGSKHVVVIGVRAADGGSALRPEVLDAVARLTTAIGEIPGVKRHTMMSVTADKAKAISGLDDEMRVEPMLPLPINQDAISALKRNLDANPAYRGTLVSHDNTLASVSFAIAAGQGGFRTVIDKVEAAIEAERSPAVEVAISGSPVFFANVERFAQRMAILFPIALIFIGLIHFEAFRTVQGLVLPLVTSLLAVVWGLGIMGLAKVPMDAFNATTPILILAVAAGHAVQILKRYYEEYDRISSLNPDDAPAVRNDAAIVESVSRMAPVMFTAGSVAVLGFFSLVTFDIATIRTFGVFTGLGILSAMFIELTFIPALRSYLRAPQTRPEAALPPQRLWDRFADRLATAVLDKRKSILSGFLLLAGICSAGIAFLNKENSTKSYFAEELRVWQDDQFLNQRLAGTNTLYVVFQGSEPGHMKDPAVLALIEETQHYIESLADVGKTLSIVDLIKQMNRSMNGGDNRFDVIPNSKELVSQYLLLYSMSGQPTDFDSYVDYEYRNANLIVWTKNDSSKYAESVVASIRGFVEPRLPQGVNIVIGGSVPQSSALSDTLIRGKAFNILQMIGVVLLAGTVIFRSFIAGLFLVVPLMVTVLVNFGVMGITGIPLNTPNSVSSAMAIGIGADYAIYLLYRIREELQHYGDLDAAIRETMRTAGKAVVFVASAIAAGYSVLMLSFNFYVHIWFGILIVLSMVVSAVAALILVPALLKAMPPAFLALTPDAALRRNGIGATGALLLLMLACPPDARAATVEADEIMQRSYQATRMDSSMSEATFHLISPTGQERVRKTFGATRLRDNGLTNRRVIRFLSPSDIRNTSTLLVENTDKDDEIWVYLPALKKTRRLASNNKKSSFVGTDLSYGDIVGHKPTDWLHRTVGEAPLAGENLFVVESTPRSSAVAEDSGYSKRVSWISKVSYVAIRTDFYDSAGVLLKTAENSEIRQVDPARNKWQAMTVRVANHQTGHKTVVQMDKFEANTSVPDHLLTVRYLEKEE